MAADIKNNNNNTTGNQLLGSITVGQAGEPISANSYSASIGAGGHDGDFNGAKIIAIASISGKYDARFDDY